MQIRKKYVNILNNINQVSSHCNTINTPEGKECSININNGQIIKLALFKAKIFIEPSARLQLTEEFQSGSTHSREKVPFSERRPLVCAHEVSHPAYS